MKRPNALELAILLVIVIGGVFAFRSGRERYQLERRYDRLKRKAGDIEIGDPAKVYVQAIETGDPRLFTWRIRLPPYYRYELDATNIQQMLSSPKAEPREFIASVGFRENGEGVLDVFSRFETHRIESHFGDSALATFLRGRWNDLRVHRLGQGALIAFDPTKPIELLKVSFPDDMRKEGQKTLPKTDQVFVPILFRMTFGPPSALGAASPPNKGGPQ